MDCGSTQTFTCSIPDKPIKWTTSGLSGISRGPFLARAEAIYHARLKSPDGGDSTQESVSTITITKFNSSDHGGTVRCINADDNSTRGMATISVGE